MIQKGTQVPGQITQPSMEAKKLRPGVERTAGMGRKLQRPETRMLSLTSLRINPQIFTRVEEAWAVYCVNVSVRGHRQAPGRNTEPTTCVDIDIDIDQGGTGEDIVSVDIEAAAAVIAVDQTGMIIEEEDTRQHKDFTIAPGLGQFRGDAMGPLPIDRPRARDEVHDLRSMIRLKRVILLTNAVIIAILVFIIAATYILAQEATGVDQQKAKRQGLQIMMI